MRRLSLLVVTLILALLPAPGWSGETQLYTVLESGLYANPRYFSVNPSLGIVWELGSTSTPAIVMPPPGQRNAVILLPPSNASRSMRPVMDFDAWDQEIETLYADLDRDDVMMRQLLLMMPVE